MSAAPARPQVFVARSPSDPTADGVVATLTDAGCAVLPATTNRRVTSAARTRAVTDAMAKAGAMVIVASADTAGSPWTAFEMGAALATDKPIYVVPVAGVLLPTYMQPAQLVEAAAVGRLVQRLRDDAAPLTPAERDALAEVYGRFGVPVDQLMFDTPALKRIADAFSRTRQPRVQPDRLLRELMTMRKQGRLPKSARRRSLGQAQPAA